MNGSAIHKQVMCSGQHVEQPRIITRLAQFTHSKCKILLLVTLTLPNIVYIVELRGGKLKR